MAEFFKIFGIAVCVCIADVFLFGLLSLIKVWDIENDDAYLVPALINGGGFAVCAAILISQWIL